ncbi:hypothetical protein HDK64DRAFT_15160 [Phyllosticta capitalensis]
MRTGNFGSARGHSVRGEDVTPRLLLILCSKLFSVRLGLVLFFMSTILSARQQPAYTPPTTISCTLRFARNPIRTMPIHFASPIPSPWPSCHFPLVCVLACFFRVSNSDFHSNPIVQALGCLILSPLFCFFCFRLSALRGVALPCFAIVSPLFPLAAPFAPRTRRRNALHLGAGR